MQRVLPQNLLLLRGMGGSTHVSQQSEGFELRKLREYRNYLKKCISNTGLVAGKMARHAFFDTQGLFSHHVFEQVVAQDGC